MSKQSKKKVACPVEVTLRVLEGRWKVMVLYYLLEGTMRFNALHRVLGGITHRTLAKQLRELEAHGIVHRKVYPEIPPRVEYSLTRLGESLRPVLKAMQDWGESYSHRLPTPSRVAQG